MINKLGKILRKIRVDHDETLKDMSEKLGVSSAFLSAVENGKKAAPDKWVDMLEKTYNLSEKEKAEIEDAIEETKKCITLDVFDVNDNQKELAVHFARRFRQLDNEKINDIKEILWR